MLPLIVFVAALSALGLLACDRSPSAPGRPSSPVEGVWQVVEPTPVIVADAAKEPRQPNHSACRIAVAYMGV